MVKVKEKVKVEFIIPSHPTGFKDNRGRKLWSDEKHEHYIVEWKDTQKRIPVSAQKINFDEFWNSKLPKETLSLRGLGINTLNKVRKLAKENK